MGMGASATSPAMMPGQNGGMGGNVTQDMRAQMAQMPGAKGAAPMDPSFAPQGAAVPPGMQGGGNLVAPPQGGRMPSLPGGQQMGGMFRGSPVPMGGGMNPGGMPISPAPQMQVGNATAGFPQPQAAAGGGDMQSKWAEASAKMAAYNAEQQRLQAASRQQMAAAAPRPAAPTQAPPGMGASYDQWALGQMNVQEQSGMTPEAYYNLAASPSAYMDMLYQRGLGDSGSWAA